MSETDDKRRGFLEFIFGDAEGFLCLAFRNPTSGEFREEFYEYPKSLPQALKDVTRQYVNNDVYYCPHLLSKPRRIKSNVLECPVAWADLDTCPPEKVTVPATLVLRTSKNNFQALWKFDQLMPPIDAEDISKRIAYAHKDDGADITGWDITQLLRMPLTYNHKYNDLGAPQQVTVLQAKPDRKYGLSDFESYPKVESKEDVDYPFPELPDTTAEEILEEYKLHLNPKVWDLFEQTPDRDWSRKLWELDCILLEAHMSREEAFIVARAAACNKYKRDNKPAEFLWKEICKAYAHVESSNKPIPRGDVDRVHQEAPLLTEEERKWAEDNPSIVDEYIEWAKGLGDAAWQYHEAGAFVVLSTLLSGYTRLPTSFGNLRLNMWFMILADTTLTRKTTAMDLAMDLVMDVDEDCVLATDGSIEGLLTSLSMRPGRSSVFLRDEFTGLMEMMSKRDYYAGMMESLTKLYDGKYQKRVLRREVIEVKDPLLVLFAGGIKERMMFLLHHEHISSGFIPRFVFVTAESDITKVKPLGPPTQQTIGKRQELIDRFTEMRDRYAISSTQAKSKVPVPVDAYLTDDAWVRYNRFEHQMVESGLHASLKELLTPTMARLALSGLKASVLLAASREDQDPEKIEVTEKDIIKGFYFVEQWREYALEVITNIGKTTQEQTIERIFRTVEREPGVLRSVVMQNFHLSARQADAVFATLEQRGMINRQKAGRTERLYPQKV